MITEVYAQYTFVYSDLLIKKQLRDILFAYKNKEEVCMSTAAGNKYGVTCNGNVCTTPDNETFTYDKDGGRVILDDGTVVPVSPTPDGMTDPVNIADYIPGGSGYIDAGIEY